MANQQALINEIGGNKKSNPVQIQNSQNVIGQGAIIRGSTIKNINPG